MKRRSFITGGSALLAGSGLGVAAAAPDAVGPGFDREFDLVVVGSGTGLAAALIAASEGLSVLVLEKAGVIGGTTLVSGGVLWVPVNRVMQREGLDDNRDDAKRYLTRLSRGQASAEIIDAFIDNGADMLEAVERHSPIRWRVSRFMGRMPDYHAEWPGAMTHGRSVETAVEAAGALGGHLISLLYEGCLAAGVEFWTEAPAQRLITTELSGSRRVSGIQVRRGTVTQNVRAHRGVILATGGFERNAEMKTHFLRGPSPYTLGAPGNRGDGIHMGMAVGADLRNMNECWHLVVYKALAEAQGHLAGGAGLFGQVDKTQPGAIVVNRHGERFFNEAGSYDASWQSFHTWENWGDFRYRNLPAYTLSDHALREAGFVAGCRAGEPLPEWVLQADTLEGLAVQAGINAAALQRTVERFNRHAAQGRDPDYHRGESLMDTLGSGDAADTLRPLTEGPYYLAEISPADLGTSGGLRVNGKAQVVDVFDQPIPGLYASGNTAGVGGPGALYGGGGGTLGPAMTFAYIAARHAAGAEAYSAVPREGA